MERVISILSGANWPCQKIQIFQETKKTAVNIVCSSEIASFISDIFIHCRLSSFTDIYRHDVKQWVQKIWRLKFFFLNSDLASLRPTVSIYSTKIRKIRPSFGRSRSRICKLAGIRPEPEPNSGTALVIMFCVMSCVCLCGNIWRACSLSMLYNSRLITCAWMIVLY